MFGHVRLFGTILAATALHFAAAGGSCQNSINQDCWVPWYGWGCTCEARSTLYASVAYSGDSNLDVVGLKISWKKSGSFCTFLSQFALCSSTTDYKYQLHSKKLTAGATAAQDTAVPWMGLSELAAGTGGGMPVYAFTSNFNYVLFSTDTDRVRKWFLLPSGSFTPTQIASYADTDSAFDIVPSPDGSVLAKLSHKDKSTAVTVSLYKMTKPGTVAATPFYTKVYSMGAQVSEFVAPDPAYVYSYTWTKNNAFQIQFPNTGKVTCTSTTGADITGAECFVRANYLPQTSSGIRSPSSNRLINQCFVSEKGYDASKDCVIQDVTGTDYQFGLPGVPAPPPTIVGTASVHGRDLAETAKPVVTWRDGDKAGSIKTPSNVKLEFLVTPGGGISLTDSAGRFATLRLVGVSEQKSTVAKTSVNDTVADVVTITSTTTWAPVTGRDFDLSAKTPSWSKPVETTVDGFACWQSISEVPLSGFTGSLKIKVSLMLAAANIPIGGSDQTLSLLADQVLVEGEVANWKFQDLANSVFFKFDTTPDIPNKGDATVLLPLGAGSSNSRVVAFGNANWVLSGFTTLTVADKTRSSGALQDLNADAAKGTFELRIGSFAETTTVSHKSAFLVTNRFATHDGIVASNKVNSMNAACHLAGSAGLIAVLMASAFGSRCLLIVC